MTGLHLRQIVGRLGFHSDFHAPHVLQTDDISEESRNTAEYINWPRADAPMIPWLGITVKDV